MATGNLVNLEKTYEISPFKGEFLANWKNSAVKHATGGPFLLIFINSSQMFSEGFLVITIKGQSFVTLNLNHSYMIYDKTYNVSIKINIYRTVAGVIKSILKVLTGFFLKICDC